MVTIACVYRTGGVYNEKHVKRLQRNVEEHCAVPYRFVCLSDAVVDGVSMVSLLHKWPGWWSKWELYRLKGPVVFLDLDTMVMGSLLPLVNYAKQHSFSMLSDFYVPHKYASGVMTWNEDMEPLYRKFLEQDVARIVSRQTMLEQTLAAKLYEEATGGIPHMLQASVAGIHSFKVHGAGKSGCMLLCFHGKPRPWDCPAVAEEWNRLI